MIETQNLVPAGASRIPNWVSGGSYVAGDQAVSIVTFLPYIRKTNGGGVTDPSSDTTNWTPLGLTIKQIILGSITITGPTVSGTATISAVNTAKSTIGFLGAYSSTGASGGGAVTLTNSTTVTAYNGAGSGNNIIRYQIVEYY